MQIRRATASDVDALAALRPYVHDQHARAHPDNFRPTTREAARREAAAWLRQANVHVLLATLSGQPIGYLRAEIFERPERELMPRRRILYLDQIALKDTARGRGHGKALLAAGITLARDLGIEHVELDVYHFNTDARAFFVAQGFVPTRERLVRDVK
jgi:diamine N-acetyltransferase